MSATNLLSEIIGFSAVVIVVGVWVISTHVWDRWGVTEFLAGSSVETFLEYLWRMGWGIVKLAIIAFVFSRLGRTETIVVSILGTLYVMISFDQLSRHFALKEIVDKVDDLTNEFTRILELVGED
jgi:hypothetical protein